MGILVVLTPWIVYWVLVGHAPFAVAASVALAVAVAALVIGRGKEGSGRTLEIGAVTTFAVLTVAALWSSQSMLARWAQPFSYAALLSAVLTGALIGKPFVRDVAKVGQLPTVVGGESFGRITAQLTWVWIAASAGMTVSSVVAPILRRDATIFDKTPLSFLCYWVIPATLFALAALAPRVLPDPLVARPDDAPRKTTFVAYGEATIDELYFLAQQHADREVGPGQEAYEVKVGGLGTPLVGDDSRKSWPSTYKVRPARR